MISVLFSLFILLVLSTYVGWALWQDHLYDMEFHDIKRREQLAQALTKEKQP